MVAPFLDVLASYTGTTMTLLCGSVPAPGNNLMFLKAIHSKSTTETRWSDHDPKGFNEAAGKFGTYVVDTNSELCFVLDAEWY